MAPISSLLADHVTLQVRSVDRLFFQGYMPRLQTQFQVIGFLLDRGLRSPRPRLLGGIGREYVSALERFIAEPEIPVVRFHRGEVKEEIAREYFKAAEREGRFGVVLVGVAQERTSAWRGWRDGGPDGHPHFEYRRQLSLRTADEGPPCSISGSGADEPSHACWDDGLVVGRRSSDRGRGAVGFYAAAEAMVPRMSVQLSYQRKCVPPSTR